MEAFAVGLSLTLINGGMSSDLSRSSGGARVVSRMRSARLETALADSSSRFCQNDPCQA